MAYGTANGVEYLTYEYTKLTAGADNAISAEQIAYFRTRADADIDNELSKVGITTPIASPSDFINGVSDDLVVCRILQYLTSTGANNSKEDEEKYCKQGLEALKQLLETNPGAVDSSGAAKMLSNTLNQDRKFTAETTSGDTVIVSGTMKDW